MNKKELDQVRDEICEFCFDSCDLMKNSEKYNTCSLSITKNHECKVWEFLRRLYKKYSI